MVDSKTFKSSIEYNKEVEENLGDEFQNPLKLRASLLNMAKSYCYNQVMTKPLFDKDSFEILTKIDEINKLTPKKLELPHTFNIEDLNGERILDEQGRIDFIREYDNDLIIDYHPSKDNSTIEYILERDKTNYVVKVKIEPVIRDNIQSKTRLTVFDEKINNKYTMFLLEEDGAISSITEFSGIGKDFRTLFKNPQTSLAIRYVEANDKSEEFVFLDSKLNSSGEVIEIKKTTEDKEIYIQYTDTQKIIDVRHKDVKVYE